MKVKGVDMLMKWNSVTRKTYLCLVISLFVVISLWNPNNPLLVTATKDIDKEEITEHASLEEKLSAVLVNKHLAGTSTAVSVMHANTGELLFSQNGSSRLHPASNMKLLTAVSALEVLGEDYQFSTEIVTDGKVKGSVLHGNLYVKGKGDPTLLAKDLQRFARDLRKLGIRKIKGNLIGDDTWYDDVRLSQDLNWSDESVYTGAQVSALTLSPNEDYDAGTVIVEVLPRKAAEGKAKLRMTPKTDYVNIVNNTKMINKDGKKDISIERKHGTNTIVVEGTMPVNGSNTKEWMSVWEPTGYVLDVFEVALNEAGISFIGHSKTTRGKTPTQANKLAIKKSIPLKELLIPFMKLSNNGHGEVLTKEMGKVMHNEGSWEKGIEAIDQVMSDMGIDPTSMLLRDGSGMSHKNMIPANVLTQLLYHAQHKPWFEVFKHSLPVAGESDRFVGGTLRERMKTGSAKGNVVAKTGSLTGMSTLSGYVMTKDQQPIIFSIMINNYLGSSKHIIAIEDQIAETLAEHDFSK